MVLVPGIALFLLEQRRFIGGSADGAPAADATVSFWEKTLTTRAGASAVAAGP
jgi:hypothetical protein